MAGRKYGLGKYGASTYDLSPAVQPPWEPIPPGSLVEIWAPISSPPPGFDCIQPEVPSGEVWNPVTI